MGFKGFSMPAVCSMVYNGNMVVLTALAAGLSEETRKQVE